MIVLRIDAHGHSADVRWAGPEAVVGSGPTAAIQRDDAGWAPREAVIVHLGTEVLLVHADGRGEQRLRVGDSVRVGHATLTLVGLLPLALGAEEPHPVAPAPARTFELEPLPAQSGTDAAARASRTQRADTPKPGSGRAAAPSTGPTFDWAAIDAAAPPASAAAARPRREQRTFDEELWEIVRRSPWWILSAAIHAILLVTLSLLAPADSHSRRSDPAYGIVSAAADPAEPFDAGGPLERTDIDRLPDEVRAPEYDDVPSIDPPPPAERDPQDPPPSPAEPEAPPDDEAQAPVTLVGPSAAATALRVSEKNVLAKKPSGPVDLARVNDDAERALEVNRKAAARVRDAIARGGGALGKVLRGLRTEDILVVRGTFDHMETVLEELSIPFTLKAPWELIQEESLSRHKMIFWNCGENVLPPRHHTALVERIREFVRDGGYLFTTDWAISNLLMPSFPGLLATDGRIKPLPEMIVSIVPAEGASGHLLLDGVFDNEATPRWWLEQASFDVKVLRKDAVQVLAESPDLARPPYNRSPVIALTFNYGRGRVLHVMGHYYQQKGNMAGAIGIQRMPLNFVRMRFDADRGAADK